jgi:hypothetical protein
VNCGNKLTFNGAVVAKQMWLFRTNGDLATAPKDEKSSSDNIAEVFNYTPDMVLAGQLLPSDRSTQINLGYTPLYDSVLSLPPVF